MRRDIHRNKEKYPQWNSTKLKIKRGEGKGGLPTGLKQTKGDSRYIHKLGRIETQQKYPCKLLIKVGFEHIIRAKTYMNENQAG